MKWAKSLDVNEMYSFGYDELEGVNRALRETSETFMKHMGVWKQWEKVLTFCISASLEVMRRKRKIREPKVVATLVESTESYSTHFRRWSMLENGRHQRYSVQILKSECRY